MKFRRWHRDVESRPRLRTVVRLVAIVALGGAVASGGLLVCDSLATDDRLQIQKAAAEEPTSFSFGTPVADTLSGYHFLAPPVFELCPIDSANWEGRFQWVLPRLMAQTPTGQATRPPTVEIRLPLSARHSPSVQVLESEVDSLTSREPSAKPSIERKGEDVVVTHTLGRTTYDASRTKWKPIWSTCTSCSMRPLWGERVSANTPSPIPMRRKARSASRPA